MKTFTLNCFQNFKCAAGDCKHSCCVGWEIDIDKTTLKKYRNCKSPFSAKLDSGVDYANAKFNMTKNGKCFFLNTDGLCDLIINLGEKALCQTCRDHPRYRNFFSDRTEYGIGLCCEVGAAALLNYNRPLTSVLVSENDSPARKLSQKRRDAEASALSFREKAFSLFCGDAPIKTAVENVFRLCGADINAFFKHDFKQVFTYLERLSDSWTDRLDKADFFDARDFSEKPAEFRRLAQYFIHRHIPAAIDETDLKSRLLFCVVSIFAINAVYKGQLAFNNKTDDSNELLIDVAREYSAEIEYSDDNVNALLDVTDRFVVS